VRDFINSRLQFSIDEDDIEIAHPLLGRKPTNTGQDVTGQQIQEPAIIARFRDRNVRDMVIRERRRLKGTPFTIKDLTSLHVEVLNRLRKSADVDLCWSWNGHIYAVLKDKMKIRVCPFQTISEYEMVC